jgi:DNA-binding transcriptional LysR family regulator
MRPHLQQVLDETSRAADLARNFRLLRQAPLRVGTLPTIGAAQLSGFLAGFRSRHPGVELTVQERPLPGLFRALEAGELEVAIASTPQPLPDAFRSEPLYRERYVVAFPRGHAFEPLEQVALRDTSGKEYVDRLACELREMVMGVCRDRRVELYAAVRTEREDWVQSMVQAGLGFAFMPEYSVTSGNLMTRPLVDPAVERAVLAVEVRGRPRSPATAFFFDALHAHRWLQPSAPRVSAAQL